MADEQNLYLSRMNSKNTETGKGIHESKLKAFSIGSMNMKKSKRELEEIKKKEEEKALAAVYEDVVASFEDTSKGGVNKSWVKGGLVNPEKKSGKSNRPGNRIYKPSSRLSETILNKRNDTPPRDENPEKYSAISNKKQDKRKSNLELFKEELKIMQQNRGERREMKRSMGLDNAPPQRKSRFEPEEQPNPLPNEDPDGDDRNFNYDDTMTTNMYLGNINPSMTEQALCEVFGRYGPLASVKIMWPRSEEERNRGKNCGFVAFMNRKDGERALRTLQGKDVEGFEMKIGWGKPIAIPPQPVYIPPSMLELSLPPPPSGMPFNAQIRRGRRSHSSDEKTLANAVVKVVIPTERSLLTIIHRMIEFVVREGPMFEAMIMNRELNSPVFRFLFENQSPAHIYYRWKLYSILQGDQLYKWRLDEFRMFKGGSLWRPPTMQSYSRGMSEGLVKNESSRRGELSDSQRDRLEDMLRDLTPECGKVGDAMVWCMDHAESAQEIVECIAESLSILQTPFPKKIARIFLVSDILYNSSAKVPNASFFRKYFESKLADIFKDILDTYNNIEGRLKADQFKQKIMCIFRAWEDWAIYPTDLLIKLQNVFLGLISVEEVVSDEEGRAAGSKDMDGMSIASEDFDGAPMNDSNNDVDGHPMEEDLDGVPINDASQCGSATPNEEKPAFKYEPSKWETVDQSTLEDQAMTTSKWEALADDNDQNEEDVDGMPINEGEESMNGSADNSPAPGERLEMTEERRSKLREIEVKVMKYADELEAGKRSRRSNMTIIEQVNQYRLKLTQKNDDERCNDKHRSRSRSGRDSSKPYRLHRHRETDTSSPVAWTGLEDYQSPSYDNSNHDSPFVNKRRGSVSPESRSSSVSGFTRSPMPAAYRMDASPAIIERHRRTKSRSPRRRHRSKSPRSRSRRHRSRSRSTSTSPSRHRHKHKKSRR